MLKVKTSIGRSKYETTVVSDSNSLIADETINNGGSGKGFTPHELLASSLGSCTCITLRMYADRKQWELDEVLSIIEIEKDPGETITRIGVEIELIGKLNDEQKKRLLEIANHCPIHKVLINSIEIKTKLK